MLLRYIPPLDLVHAVPCVVLFCLLLFGSMYVNRSTVWTCGVLGLYAKSGVLLTIRERNSIAQLDL